MSRQCSIVVAALLAGVGAVMGQGIPELATPIAAGQTHLLVQPIPAGVPLPEAAARMQRLLYWPTPSYIATHLAVRDREKEYPSVHLQPRSKPVEFGAIPPEAARSDAVFWLRTAQLPLWFQRQSHPVRLEIALIQEPDPSLSSALYCAEGPLGRITVLQQQCEMCVVFRPKPELIEGVAPEAFAQMLFPLVFQRSGEMLARPDVVELELPQGFYGQAALRFGASDWPEWQAWYTDGQAIAIHLIKHSPAVNLLPGVGDPWF